MKLRIARLFDCVPERIVSKVHLERLVRDFEAARDVGD